MLPETHTATTPDTLPAATETSPIVVNAGRPVAPAEDGGARLMRRAGPLLGLGSLAAIALGVTLFAGPRGAPTAVPAPEPTYELVATCKGPLLRRNLEQLVRRNDGKLFYKDDRGTLTAIADDVKPDEVCRSVGKKFWQ